MSKKYWGKTWCEAGLFGAWTYAKIRPRWWWFLVRVWEARRWIFTKGETNWIGLEAVWAITALSTGLPPCEIHHGPRKEPGHGRGK